MPFPIEARLSPLAAPSVQPPAAPPSRQVAPPRPAPLPPASEPQPHPELPEQAAAHDDQLAEAPDPAVPTPAVQPERHEEVSVQVARQMPAELKMRYEVLAGDEGFRLGYANYQWRSQAGQYTLVSVAEASGLAAMFINGRITQVSQGELAPYGLRPRHYWLQRGANKQDTVRFDWESGRLTFLERNRSEGLAAMAQDLLSFPFQLAMTARIDMAPMLLPITNGKKLRTYQFHRIGAEIIQISGVNVHTLHLQGVVGEGGYLDVWLAIDQGGLPVKIRTVDDTGRAITLLAADVPGSVDAEQAPGPVGEG